MYNCVGNKELVEHRINTIFSLIVILMVLCPICFVNCEDGVVSETENRILADYPELRLEDGEWNIHFISEFEAWINDHIGFRELMVSLNNKVAYYLFHKIDDNIFFMLGPHNELNFTPDYILEDYHHLNLLSDGELKDIVVSHQIVKDYLTEKGIQYFRMQCWDKQTIYPEQFPQYINQYGDMSKTDQVVQAIELRTTIQQPDLKTALMEAKSQYPVFPVWGDVGHWNQRGAFIGYSEIMNLINANNKNKYHILTENDFEIQMEDIGTTILGNIHEKDISEVFYLKCSNNVSVDNSKLTLCGEDERSSFWINENIDNEDRLLIIGDSYISDFLTQYFAESFHNVIFIHLQHTPELINIINEYEPDIVLNESAERNYAYDLMNSVAEIIIEEEE